MRVPKIAKPPAFVPREIHPEGMFDGKLLEWGEIRKARSGMLWYLNGTFETEHGKVWSAFAGLPGTLDLIKALEQECKAKTFKVRVRHRYMDDARVFASADAYFEGAGL